MEKQMKEKVELYVNGALFQYCGAGIQPPLIEPENSGTFVKFMSDHGELDNAQGDAFADWLGAQHIRYERLCLGEKPMERRKFIVYGAVQIGAGSTQSLKAY